MGLEPQVLPLGVPWIPEALPKGAQTDEENSSKTQFLGLCASSAYGQRHAAQWRVHMNVTGCDVETEDGIRGQLMCAGWLQEKDKLYSIVAYILDVSYAHMIM